MWRKVNEELDPKNLKSTVKRAGGSVMIWGCMTSFGVGNLHFIDGIMDQKIYLDILRKNVKESTVKLGVNKKFNFNQDSDPKHMAYKVRQCLLYNCPHFMELSPQSPDLK